MKKLINNGEHPKQITEKSTRLERSVTGSQPSLGRQSLKSMSWKQDKLNNGADSNTNTYSNPPMSRPVYKSIESSSPNETALPVLNHMQKQTNQN